MKIANKLGAADATQHLGGKSPQSDAKAKEAEKVATEFETMYVDMMLKAMRNTAKPEDGSNAQDIYQGMLDTEYAQNMTKSQSFGVRDMLLNWMQSADPGLKTDAKAAYQEYKTQAQFSAAKPKL